MLRLKIVSPDEIFFEGECSFLEFVSVNGAMGVYPNHIPLTTILESGVMKIHQGDEVRKIAVLGGFIEILPERITVMAEDANWPDEIDVARARAAKERAEAYLQRREKGTDLLRAEAALKRAVARIETAKS